jgi:autotransporter-associated beta strand protein
MIGTTTDTTAFDSHLRLTFNGTSLANNLQVGSMNGEGVSTVQLTGASIGLSGALEINRTAGRNLAIVSGAGASVALQGAISGSGGLTITGGGTFTVSGANSYGTLTGAPGAAVNGGTVVRSGSLQLASASALGASTTIELGDATYSHANVDWATNGASILGVERNTDFDTQRNSGLGGAFEATAGGLTPGGVPNAGPGAFYNVSRVVDGRTFGSADIGKTILVKDEVLNPERNGIYSIVQMNADGSMNLVRTSTFSTATNMLYGTQVTVQNGASAGTYFMAAPDVASVNGTGTDPVFWQSDVINPNVTLRVTDPGVTVISQAVDVNANGSGTTTIASATPVTFSGAVTLQDVHAGAADTKTLTIDSTAASGLGMVFSGVIAESISGAADDVLSLAKIGTGTLTLSGANSYKGGTTVSAGALMLNNSSGSGTGLGSVSINGTSVLGGSGIIAPGANSVISIASTASLNVGAPGDITGQSFRFNLQATNMVNIAGSVGLQLFSNTSGNPVGEADRLIFSGAGASGINIISGATLALSAVSPLSSTSFNVGDSWQLFDWGAAAVNGKFTGLDPAAQQYVTIAGVPLSSGLSWDISQLYTLGTIVVAVPEPSRMLTLLLGLLALALRRRRK